MSFTTKSESVPEVETRNRGAIGTGDGDVVIERLGLIDQHVGAPRSKALVGGHVVARHSGADITDHGHGLVRIADVFVEPGIWRGSIQ